LALTLTPEAERAALADRIAKYEKQKTEIKAAADKLEEDSAKANASSAALAVPREKYMYGLALLQIAISVGSVTVLTGQRWLFFIALAGGILGLVAAGLAYFAP
jgi:Flp pilus assembly protein TadB